MDRRGRWQLDLQESLPVCPIDREKYDLDEVEEGTNGGIHAGQDKNRLVLDTDRGV
jgi:hypothetical protein